MPLKKLTWLGRNSLTEFFFLAYILSWAVEIPLALQANHLIQTSLPFSLHYLAGYGPLLAALIVTGLSQGSGGLKDIFTRMFDWRVKPEWWLVAVSPLLLLGLAVIILRLTGGPEFSLSLLGQVDFLPEIGPLGALFLWILTFGLGEETGWRGFALPRLQKRNSALGATLILCIFWAGWHLPAFFYLYDPKFLPGWLLGMLAGAIFFTWLYNSTGGSILIVSLFHGIFNFTTGCTACKSGLVAPVISAVVMLWAVVVVIIFKPRNLSRAEKQVI